MFHIFNSIFWVQFYSTGASIIMGLHYYHIMFDLCEMNSVFEDQYFLGFCFSESIFFGFLLVAKYFLGHSEIPNSADPCLLVCQVLPLGVKNYILFTGRCWKVYVCLYIWPKCAVCVRVMFNN